MKKEQRTHQRSVPTGNVYAALGRAYEKVGKLIDLSPGGLAFEYMANENKQKKYTQIGIFRIGEVFNLHNLPCKIVYDISIRPPRSGIESLKKFPNRRCGVEFKSMPAESKTHLALFLEAHTNVD
jgi:hypothetical protein